VGSIPGRQDGLQLAQFSFFEKQVMPDSLQQPVLKQLSPFAEHRVATQAAALSPPK
jgi:hypothetical protein